MIPLTQPSGREPDDHAPVYPRLPCCRHWPFAMSEMGSACVKTKTDLVVLGKPSDPELDQFGTTVKPGRLEVLEIDDTFCAAHGGQQLAFWNAHHDERGFASMHIYHVASGTPVVAILRPARTPKGTEVRTVIKHVTKRLRKHWPNTRIVWRGDGHYGRVEAMEWAEDNDTDYIFGLAGNAVLDALAAEAADNLRFHHAMNSNAKLRTFASFFYTASSWNRPRKVVARLGRSLPAVPRDTAVPPGVDN